MKSHYTGQSFKHPSSLIDNQHVNTSSVYSKYVWTGQGVCSVKETPKSRPNIMEVDYTSGCRLCEVDWGAHDSSLFLYLEQIFHDGESQDFFALQRSFKTLFSHSKISDDENNFGKCVMTSHHVNANLVTGKVVAAAVCQAIDFLEKRDGQDQQSSQGGVIEFYQ